jgi:hypothetical protein
MNKEIKININEHVKLKITDFGKQLITDKHNYYAEISKSVSGKYFIQPAKSFKQTIIGKYHTKGKWSEMQIHELFRYFGEYTSQENFKQCIEDNNIYYEVENE